VEWSVEKYAGAGAGSSVDFSGRGSGPGTAPVAPLPPSLSEGEGFDALAQHAALAARAARCALALAQLTPPRPPGMTGEMALHTALAFGMVPSRGAGGRFRLNIHTYI